MRRRTKIKPRASLQYFVNFQERVLKDNDYKDGWVDMLSYELLTSLKDEVAELQEALADGDTVDIKKECADVANFAMMIFDNSKGGK